jgi:hypothetical protein
VDAAGIVWHTIRHSNGSWDDWGEVSSLIGLDRWINGADLIALAGIGKELHAVLMTPSGRLFYTLRDEKGEWQALSELDRDSGLDPSVAVKEVAIAGTPEGELYVAILSSTGEMGYAVRASNGSWSGWSSLSSAVHENAFAVQSLSLGSTMKPPEKTEGEDSTTDSAQDSLPFVSTGIHLVALMQNGQLFHSLRMLNGRWQSLGQLSGVAGNTGTAARAFAAGVGDELHVVASGPVALPIIYPNVLYGDANGSGKIDVRDAILTLRFITGIQKPTDVERARADAETDGQLDVRDVIRILRCAAGISCRD